jgi:hypothetical protein
MTLLPGWLQDGYRRAIDPVADWLVRRRVNPNTIKRLVYDWSVVV